MTTTPQYGVGQYGVHKYGVGGVPGVGVSPVLRQQFNLASYVNHFTSLEARTVFNQFDEHGLMVGLGRLRGESNSSYRRRILDVFANRANASYRGLINGITRELGLSLFQPIEINPKRSLVDERFFAPDPYIKISGAYIYLYSDYNNGILDHKIDRYISGGNYERIGALVDFINSTTYFEASIASGFDTSIKSMTLLSQSNRGMVSLESIPASAKFQLKHRYTVPDSLVSDNTEIFSREVSSEASVTSTGQYYINHLHGVVKTYHTPGIDVGVQYEYTIYPFKPIASNIILNDINNEEFRIKMFEQVLQTDGTYIHGLPTELGVDIINEIMSVSPMYWGV